MTAPRTPCKCKQTQGCIDIREENRRLTADLAKMTRRAKRDGKRLDWLLKNHGCYISIQGTSMGTCDYQYIGDTRSDLDLMMKGARRGD